MSVRQRFVRQVLESAGERMLERQERSISELTVSRSGRLLHDRKTVVSSGSEMDGRLSFTHPIYERFLDIRKKEPGKRHKRRRIHNRFIYGAYASIAERLMYGLTDEVVESIHKEMGRE